MSAYLLDATPVTASPARARRTPLWGTPLRVMAPSTRGSAALRGMRC